MLRKLITLLICGMITIAVSPTILSATDDVDLTGVSDAKAVETVIAEPEPESRPVVAKAPAAGHLTPATPVISNYTVNSHVGTFDEFERLAYSLADGVIYKFHKMIYGHSRSTALGNLGGKYAGETITVTEGGTTTSYRVAASVHYSIEQLNMVEENGRTVMDNIAFGAKGHSIALFTCEGNGRRVVFADAM